MKVVVIAGKRGKRDGHKRLLTITEKTLVSEKVPENSLKNTIPNLVGMCQHDRKTTVVSSSF
jgi:hypothetical protein